MAFEPDAPRAPVHAGSAGASDSELLGLIAQGDLTAFEVVYDRHVVAVWKVALHFSATEADAERAVFAVFFGLWTDPKPNSRTSLPARLLPGVWQEVRAAQRAPEEDV